MTEVFRGTSRSLQANAVTLNEIRERPLLCLSSFDAAGPQTVTRQRPKISHTYLESLFFSFNFHSCTVHLDVIKSFIRPTNAQVNCFIILKFTFIVNFNVNFNILKQFNRVLVERIKYFI
jgi:hypothetical protein